VQHSDLNAKGNAINLPQIFFFKLISCTVTAILTSGTANSKSFKSPGVTRTGYPFDDKVPL
jgi:hypothetical protein